MPLENRSVTRQWIYLLIAFLGLIAITIAIAGHVL